MLDFLVVRATPKRERERERETERETERGILKMHGSGDSELASVRDRQV